MFVVKSASCTLDSRRLSKRQEALIKNKQKNFNASQAFSLLFVQTTKASWKMRTIIMRPLANRKTITHYHTHTHRNRNVCGSLIGRGGSVDMIFLDILKACGANFDWNQTLSGFGLSPPKHFSKSWKGGGSGGFWGVVRWKTLQGLQKHSTLFCQLRNGYHHA